MTIVFTAVFVFGISRSVFALDNTDQAALQQNVDEIVVSINKGDSTNIIAILSPNAAPELISALKKAVDMKKLEFQQQITGYKELTTNKIQLDGVYAVTALNWNSSGLGDSFVFEKLNGKWLLLDTDVASKLDPSSVVGLIGKIFGIAALITLIPAIFWLWMLIDAIRKPIENKPLWIILIILLNLLGAILYFFIPRRALKNKLQAAVVPPVA